MAHGSALQYIELRCRNIDAAWQTYLLMAAPRNDEFVGQGLFVSRCHNIDAASQTYLLMAASRNDEFVCQGSGSRPKSWQFRKPDQ